MHVRVINAWREFDGGMNRVEINYLESLGIYLKSCGHVHIQHIIRIMSFITFNENIIFFQNILK